MGGSSPVFGHLTTGQQVENSYTSFLKKTAEGHLNRFRERRKANPQAGSHGMLFMPWVCNALALKKPTAHTPCRGYSLGHRLIGCTRRKERMT
jgi:hypothetical protein